MPVRREVPSSHKVVKTYGELEKYVSAFANGHLNLLILVGEAGLAKTNALRRAVGKFACWFEGNTTPWGMYLTLHENRDKTIVIDDVDSLYANASGIRLLKCLCQTEPVKRVSWISNMTVGANAYLPSEFETKSRVALIANEWKTLSENVGAVEDRGHVIIFKPSAQEIHRETRKWFNDTEIYNWFGKHLHVVAKPSMRMYVRARELKAAGMDWKQEILESEAITLPPIALIVASIVRDSKYKTVKAKVAAFAKHDLGGTRSTYFLWVKKLKELGIL